MTKLVYRITMLACLAVCACVTQTQSPQCILGVYIQCSRSDSCLSSLCVIPIALINQLANICLPGVTVNGTARHRPQPLWVKHACISGNEFKTQVKGGDAFCHALTLTQLGYFYTKEGFLLKSFNFDFYECQLQVRLKLSSHRV